MFNLLSHKSVKIFFSVFLIIVIGVIILYNNFVVVGCVHNIRINKMGIIDGRLSFKPDDVLLSENTKIDENKSTHSDEMISFANKYCDSLDIYYYDASDMSNEITTDNIINGLNWMVKNNITKVNLSLSSKIYSKNLEDWINENKDIITIYTSYNNRMNSFDYPAMYEYVIASGYNNKIEYKDIVAVYKSNRIIMMPECSMYTGNSYLSLITMINAK